MNSENEKMNPYNPTNKLITISDISNIYKKLDIRNIPVTNLKLYQTAFIHKSYCKLKEYENYDNLENSLPLQDKSYETLEFLGDSLIGSIISSYLYKRYGTIHEQEEGFLTKMKIRLVCGEQLAYLSSCLDLGDYIIISKYVEESRIPGRKNKNILEDIFEALIGAIYLDTHDYLIVEELIIHIIEKYVDFSNLILKDNNYKDQLLRYFQHNYKIYPIYKTSKCDDNTFICKIYKNEEFINDGCGESKKKAEQTASYNSLKKFHVISE